MYPKARRSLADYSSNVLKLANNNKLADKGKLPVVKKGKFAGYVIFTLTLEERATCPRDCFHWDDCYGNNMAFAHRIEHGPKLEKRIKQEIEQNCNTYKGVIVRLHILGDFYSVDYVELWQGLLAKHNNLAVWGFTGYKPNSDIGLALRAVRGGYGERFAVRFSDALDMRFSANSVERTEPIKGQSFVCPEQTGKAKNCANCALCWSANDRQVLFLTH